MFFQENWRNSVKNETCDKKTKQGIFSHEMKNFFVLNFTDFHPQEIRIGDFSR